MNYKTIALELLLQHPQLWKRHKQNRTMLEAVNRHAIQLKTSHESMIRTLARSRPKVDPSQISSEALEYAVRELEEELRPEPTEPVIDLISLDQAMAFLRRQTPSE